MFSAWSAVVEFEPSINSWTVAGCPARRSRVKCGGICIPTVRASFPDFARHLLDVLDFADDPECLRVDEAIEELPALDGAILIQDRHRHVLHVVIERVTERDHLDERREEHEEQRHRIAQDRDEFLEEDRVEAAEGSAFHGAPAASHV